MIFQANFNRRIQSCFESLISKQLPSHPEMLTPELPVGIWVIVIIENLN